MTELRQRNGWTQEELAQRLTDLGCVVSFHVIANMERREQVISVDFAFALATVFGVTMTGLLEEACETCNGRPPIGFSCKECGRS